MDNKALTQWIRDYANIKPNQVDNNNDDDEEDDEDEEEPSWFEDDGKIPVLDLDWWARDRDVSKHIPKLTTIILGQIIKTVNYLATSGDLDQLDKLKAIMPTNLIPAIQSQLSFTALRNFLKLPLSNYFDRTSVQLETVIGCIKQEEDVYRYLYHHHPTHPFLSQTENQLLFNVFENYELFTKGEIDPYQYPVVEVGLKVLPNLNDHEPVDAIPDTYAINNREKFQERWNELTGGVLQHVNWTNVFAAGGSILHCLRVMSEQAWKLILRTETEDEMFNADQLFFQPFSNIEYEKGEYKSTDIDLYIYGLSIEQTRAKVQEIFESITKVDPKATFMHEGPTVTIYGPTFKPIQIILCLHKSPAEVLLHYDLNCVCVGYNGNSVMCLPKFVIGMKYKMNFLDSSMNTQDKFQITRLHKYKCRGYSTSLPLHFRMHGYFDQEIPSNEELAKDTNHPVYYFICMILHIAKWRFMKDSFKNHPLGVGYGVWRWERFWTSGLTLGQRRQPGPKKNNVVSNNDQEIPLPIDENQDLVVYTKQLQKAIWTEPMTRYFEINHTLDGMFNDRGVEKEMARLTETLEELEITSYNDNPYLQHFYLNCCVKTKTHTPDLSKFENPYLGLNTSVARVVYDNASKKVALNINALEAGRVLSDPIDICGRRWQLILESGPGMPIVFMHLKLLPEIEPRDPFSSMDQAPILAANFIIKLKGHSDPANTIEPRDLAIDGSKIFNETSDTWSTYFHGTYISAKAANPLNIRCEPNERSNCIFDDSITIRIIVQTLTIYTPAIAF